MRCRGPECEREARPGRDLCDGHRSQHDRALPLTPLRPYTKGRKDPMVALKEASTRLENAEDEREYRRALRALVDAAVGYVRLTGRKWTSFRKTMRQLVF